MTTTHRPARQCEIAADEGYNLSGAPVLLAKLTAYVSRPVFAYLRAISTSTGGEYSAHLSAFMWPIDCPAARESFAAQARVILSNPPAPAATPKRAAGRMYPTIAGMVYATSPHEANEKARDEAHAPARARVAAGRSEYRAAHPETSESPAQVYTDAPAVETPPEIRVSTSRPIAHTITDRTPADYGPSQPSLL